MNQVRSKFDLKMVNLWDWAYLSNRILDKFEILQENIRYMKIYYGKFSSQMELGNIIFQRVKFNKLILSNISNNTFVYCLRHI